MYLLYLLYSFMFVFILLFQCHVSSISSVYRESNLNFVYNVTVGQNE